jgi:hypothetical protein
MYKLLIIYTVVKVGSFQLAVQRNVVPVLLSGFRTSRLPDFFFATVNPMVKMHLAGSY